MDTQGKKIMLLHPMVEGIERMRRYFAGVEDIAIVGLTEGPAIIHNRKDAALVGPDTIRKALEGEKAGYQAIVLSCHGDPNLNSVREAVRIPVIGPMEVAANLPKKSTHTPPVPKFWSIWITTSSLFRKALIVPFTACLLG